MSHCAPGSIGPSLAIVSLKQWTNKSLSKSTLKLCLLALAENLHEDFPAKWLALAENILHYVVDGVLPNKTATSELPFRIVRDAELDFLEAVSVLSWTVFF